MDLPEPVRRLATGPRRTRPRRGVRALPADRGRIDPSTRGRRLRRTLTAWTRRRASRGAWTASRSRRVACTRPKPARSASTRAASRSRPRRRSTSSRAASAAPGPTTSRSACGGVGLARADRVSVEMGAWALPWRRRSRLTQGVARTLVAAASRRVDQGLIGALVAGKVDLPSGRSGCSCSSPLAWTARVKAVLDWRGALAFGVAFGLLSRSCRGADRAARPRGALRGRRTLGYTRHPVTHAGSR